MDGTAPYSVDGTAGSFFLFTSNVDAHSFDHFEAHEIRECHGNVELWQCAATFEFDIIFGPSCTHSSALYHPVHAV